MIMIIGIVVAIMTTGSSGGFSSPMDIFNMMFGGGMGGMGGMGGGHNNNLKPYNGDHHSQTKRRYIQKIIIRIIITKVEGTQTKQSQWFTSWEWRWRNFTMERFEYLGNDELCLWFENIVTNNWSWRFYNYYIDDLTDKEACGDARSRLRRLWREGWDQCEELHRLQGEGGQDTDHPGWEREKVEKAKKYSPPSQMGPGMVQQSQAVCGECDGRGEIIPPSSRWLSMASFVILTNSDQYDRCKGCKGKKTTKEKKVIEIELDKGCPSDFR